MSDLAVILSGAILAILVARALWIMRAEKGARRGSEPGRGDHVIEANYFSGGGGGGHAGQFTVPKDPQDYARRFVPRQKGTR